MNPDFNQPQYGQLTTQEHILIGQATNLALDICLKCLPDGCSFDGMMVPEFKNKFLQATEFMAETISAAKDNYVAKRDARLRSVVTNAMNVTTAPQPMRTL
jgi:hypothetical protein